MPQTEPMSADAVVKQWADDEYFHDFAESHGAVLRNFARWFMKRDSQRDRDTLTKAADRACESCGKDMVKFCKKKKGGIEGNPCDTRKAILAPLAEGGK